jgi:hypothetical protein
VDIAADSDMALQAAKYELRSMQWEPTALAVAAGVIALATGMFALLILRDAWLIQGFRTGIDAKLYTETHLYILLVEVILWGLMARAAIRFKMYTHEIAQSRDGRALGYIANAILLSIPYAILFDMASSFKTLFVHTQYLSLVTTITNLLPLAIFLVLSVLLYIGSLRLRNMLSEAPLRWQYITNLSLVIFSLAVVPYVQYFYRVAPTLVDDDELRHFALSPNVLVVAYVIPFAAVWLLGLVSCLNIAQYASRINGKLYRPMFRSLYIGILISYASTYFIQVFYASNLSSNKFGPGLVILVGLIAMLIVGYGLMYRGANQLYRLEQ